MAYGFIIPRGTRDVMAITRNIKNPGPGDLRKVGTVRKVKGGWVGSHSSQVYPAQYKAARALYRART